MQALLIAQFSFFGVSKVIGTADMAQTFDTFGFPGWFMLVTGIIEIVAVLCLVTGFFKDRFVYFGTFLIFGLTIGAFLSHSLIEGSMVNAIPPLVVLAQAGIVIWLHSKVSGLSPSGALSLA